MPKLTNPSHLSTPARLILTGIILLCIFFLILLILPNFHPVAFFPGLHQPSAAQAETKLPPPPPLPTKSAQAPSLDLQAQGIIAIDTVTGAILFEQNPDIELMPASTTKLMTALVALDAYSLDQIITIDQEDRTIGNTMKLVKSEQLTVSDLLYGALVASGNDAALALALSYPNGGYTGFVAAMNQKAADLGLTHTHYQNVSGVESPGHVTTARDLSRLTLEALNNSTLRRIVATKKVLVTSTDGKYHHQLVSTNELLGTVDGVMGVKTGWTENAGECLVTYVSRNNHSIITVILDSPDRFGESQQLIDWIYSNYTWTNS